MKAIGFIFPGRCALCSHHHHNAIKGHSECMGAELQEAQTPGVAAPPPKAAVTASDYVSQEEWLSAPYESPRPRTFITANTREAHCMKRLPRSRIVPISCFFVA